MGFRLATGMFLVALALLGINLIGVLIDPSRHPLALEPVVHKQGLVLVGAAESRARLAALAPSDSGDFLTRATEIIASGVRHHWPEEHEYDEHASLQIHENWVVALLGWGERLLVAAGALNEYRFARLERLRYEHILSKGIGFCSQASLALSSYLTSVGTDARLIGLDGHVVVASHAGGQDYLLDPDYNVVIQASLQEVEDAPELAARAYLAAGYSAERAGQLGSIYGAEGNFVGDARSYHPNHQILRLSLDLLKWAVPVLGIAAWVWARRRRGA